MNYKYIYDQVYKAAPDYGDHNHGSGCVDFINKYKFDRVIELGCGSMAWLEMLDSRHCVGVDVSAPNATVMLDITKGLPFDDGEFDLLAAFDVLEHIALDDLDFVLSEMKRMAPRCIVSIGYIKSGSKINGLDELHLIIENQRWWIDRIKSNGMKFNRILPPKYLCFGEW